MDERLAYSAVYLLSMLVSAISQIMLKLSAKRKYGSWLREYLNPLGITAYVLFFGCTFLTMYALKVVPLSASPILGASGYIFITILSKICLKEKVSKRKLCGLLVILFGIVIYSL